MVIGVNSIRRGPVSGINMTPMLGVLLVLVVLFLAVHAGMQRGLGVWIPSAEPADGWMPQSEPQVVLVVEPGLVYRLDRQPVRGSLQQALAGIFAERPRKEIFVIGDERVTYGEVVRALDAVRGAGVQGVTLVPLQRTTPGLLEQQ
jgi:biopolymer transport protein ExbD